MTSIHFIMFIALLALFSYYYGMKRAVKVAGGRQQIQSMHSLPQHFGLLSAFTCALPALILLLFWAMFETQVIDALLIASLPESVQL